MPEVYDWSNFGQTWGDAVAQQRDNSQNVVGGQYVPDYQPIGDTTQSRYLIDLNRQNEQIGYQRERDAMFDAQMMERDARIQSSLGRVSNIFAGRNPLYGQYADDTYALSKTSLDDEQQMRAQQLKFALARSGLTAGSVDIDKGADLANKYAFGLQQARSHADAAGDTLRGQDSALKSSLMGLAASGAVGGDQMASLSGEALSAVDTSPASMQNPGQFYTGLYDQIGAAGGGGFAQPGANPYSGGGGNYRASPGQFSGTVS